MSPDFLVSSPALSCTGPGIPSTRGRSTLLYILLLTCLQLTDPKPREVTQGVLGPMAEAKFLVLGSVVFSYYKLIFFFTTNMTGFRAY